MAARLPSIALVASNAWRTFRRFPGAILCGIAAAGAAMVAMQRDANADRPRNVAVIAALGIALFCALQVLWERSRAKGGLVVWDRWRALAYGAGLVALGGCLLFFDRLPESAIWFRVGQLAVIAHLAVAVAPYLRADGGGDTHAIGLWQWNRRLLMQLLLSALYAFVIFVGAALALLAIEQLFDVKFAYGGRSPYLRLWLVTVFVFQTWHFLAAVPSDIDALDSARDYPRGLRIFSQYVLVPLVTLYVFILYAYGGKVLVTRSWPEGWVGWLVSYAAIVGVLTSLLLAPARLSAETRWAASFSKLFHAAILPLLGLLFVALGRRVGEYGWTERRYFLAVLGAWLAVIAVYMLVRRHPNLRAVPLTLLACAAVTAGGPWGAFATARASQSRQLDSLLVAHGLYVSGELVPVKAASAVPSTDIRRMSALANYLVRHHGPAALRRWSATASTSTEATPRSWEAAAAAREFMAQLGLPFLNEWETTPERRDFEPDADEVDIRGHDLIVRVTLRRGSSAIAPNTATYSAQLTSDGRSVEVLRGQGVVATIPLASLLDRLKQSPSTPLPARFLTAVGEGPTVGAMLCLSTVTVEWGADGAPAVERATGVLLIDQRPSQ